MEQPRSQGLEHGAWTFFKQQQFWGPGCWPTQSSSPDARAQAVALRPGVWVHVEQPQLWSPRCVWLVRGAPLPGAAPSGGCTGPCPSLGVTAVVRAAEVCSALGCRRVLHSKPLGTTMAPVMWMVLRRSAVFFVAGHLMSHQAHLPAFFFFFPPLCCCSFSVGLLSPDGNIFIHG